MRLERDDRCVIIDGRRWPAQFNCNNIYCGPDNENIHCTRQALVVFENGWCVSVMWGTATYSDNHDYGLSWVEPPQDVFIEEPEEVEIAAWNLRLKGAMIEWPNGDTVMGYVSVSYLPSLFDLISHFHSDEITYQSGIIDLGTAQTQDSLPGPEL